MDELLKQDRAQNKISFTGVFVFLCLVTSLLVMRKVFKPDPAFNPSRLYDIAIRK